MLCTLHASVVQEDLIRFPLEDIELHVGNTARRHDAGVMRACPQYIDEGLVQRLLVVCERIQNAPLALKTLSLLSRTLGRLPVPPNIPRATTSSGVRVPSTLTYLGAIHACCGTFPGARIIRHVPLQGTLVLCLV